MGKKRLQKGLVLFSLKKNTKPVEVMCKFNSLYSLREEEIGLLLPVFDKHVKKKIRHYTLKGKLRRSPILTERKDKSLKGSYIKLKFYLMYLKHNLLQVLMSDIFEISQSKVSEWVHFLTGPFYESLKELKALPQFGDIYTHMKASDDFLLIDVVENEVPRQTDLINQKEEYSGKKKNHTMKYLAIGDQSGSILFLSSAYFGTVHDKKIYDEMTIDTNEKYIVADLGFQGIQKEYERVIMPYKKSKNKPLTVFQKEINKRIGSIRVRIEHAFAGVKRLKIIKDKIRLKYFETREKIMKIAVGIHNFRIACRSSLIIHS